MDPRSEKTLIGVHPDLAKVIRGAAQDPQGFVVIQGLRNIAQEASAVATGHSMTMRSRHLPDSHYTNSEFPNGVACAVDVAAFIAGHVSFAAGREEEVFGQIAKQIQQSADAFKIPIQWGGAPVGAWIPGKVSTFRDWGHFQLPWREYP